MNYCDILKFSGWIDVACWVLLWGLGFWKLFELTTMVTKFLLKIIVRLVEGE